MIPITKEPISWTADDAEGLQKFLETPLGNRFIQKLTQLTPTFAPAHVAHDHSFAQSRDRAGFEMAIASIADLAFPIEENNTKDVTTTSSAYPALEDDAAWADIESNKN